MKRTGLIVVTFALLVAARARAQEYAVDRGVWLVGGSGYILNRTGQGGSVLQVDLSPQVGYFPVPRLAVTASLSFGYWHQSSSGSHTVTYGIGPGLRYYFGGPGRRVIPYVSVDASYVHGDFTGPTSGSYASWLHQEAAGAAWFVARNVALTTALFYQHQRFSVGGSSQKTSSDEYGLQLGVSVFAF